ncbi:MAG TPA: SAM-dependent methyltransferase, partial [Streptosporangiaceae bacterium]|nr:SAM-dependent methyltransferase [Streptosporangiaceae bacterium]
MTSNGAPAGSAEPAEIDTSVAHAARVYDYLLGGRANFKVDREVAAVTYAAWPGGIDAVRADVREHRAALGRVVRYFVRDAGITQFLDIGTGIPKENNVHEVAQDVASDARIVYVDRDPIVLAHAHQLLRGTREGSISYIYGDLHDPQPILAEAAKTLDFSRPTAVMLFGILHFF